MDCRKQSGDDGLKAPNSSTAYSKNTPRKVGLVVTRGAGFRQVGKRRAAHNWLIVMEPATISGTTNVIGGSIKVWALFRGTIVGPPISIVIAFSFHAQPEDLGN